MESVASQLGGSVVMDKEPDCGDMVLQLLRERERLADKPTNALPERTVKAFGTLGSFSFAVVPVSEYNRLVSSSEVGMTRGVQVAGGQAIL